MANHEAFSLTPFPVEILYMRYDVIQEWNLIDLQMPYWRLYRPVNACGYIHFKDRTIHLMPGKIYLIAPNTVFTTSTRGGLIEKFYLHFTIGGLYADCSDFVAELAGSPPLHGVIDRLSELLQARQGGDALKLLG